jgi:hypothetical protein
MISMLLTSQSAAPSVTEIPFEFGGYHTFIEVRLKGKTLSFVFDTGAAGVALNETTARRLGIEPSSYGMATGAGGSMRIGMARGLRMGIASLRLENVTAAVLPLAHLEEYIGRPLDGIIGRDVMRGRVVLLDHDRNVIEIHPRKAFPFKDWGPPCRLLGGALPTVKGEVELLDGTKLPGKFHIDTGAGLYLSLNSPFADRHGLESRIGVTYPRTGRALTGVAIHDTIGQVASVGFCGYQFPPPGTRFPVGLSGATEGVQADKSGAGLVGNAVLRRFNIAFDIAANKMYLKPNSGWDAPIRSDATGLLFKHDRHHTNRVVKVIEVVSGSPAAEAGLEIGDRIVSVDGVGAETVSLADLRDRFMETGKVFQVEADRDGVMHHVELRSRSLFAEAASRSEQGSPATSPAHRH